MAVKRSLWSLTLLPGEKTPLFVQRDFCLTNAALGEELRDEKGRSVVKVTHQPIPSSLFDDESSDEDEDEESEEEFELDEVEGFKLTPKKAKANGIANGDVAEEDEDEEDDDEEEAAAAGELPEDSSDDDDYSDSEDGLEQTNVLCSLLAGRVEQATLDLTFCEGDVVIFEVTGENSVHLMGNYVIQPDPDLSDSEYDSELDSEFDSEGEDDFDELYGSADEDDEMDVEGEATIEEIDEKPAAAKPIVKAAAKSAAKEEKPKAKAVEAPETKKRKADVLENVNSAPATASTTEGLSKSQKKKLAKKAKLESEGASAPAPAANGTAKTGGEKQKVRK